MAPYELPDLPYGYSALEPHCSGTIMELHHQKIHAGAAVAAANSTLERLAESRAKGDYGAVVGLEKTLVFNLGSRVLHSLFWENLAPDGGGTPEGDLAAAIDDAFGSFDQFRTHLTAAAVTVQGSGWGALVWEPVGSRLLITTTTSRPARSRCWRPTSGNTPTTSS